MFVVVPTASAFPPFVLPPPVRLSSGLRVRMPVTPTLPPYPCRSQVTLPAPLPLGSLPATNQPPEAEAVLLSPPSPFKALSLAQLSSTPKPAQLLREPQPVPLEPQEIPREPQLFNTETESSVTGPERLSVEPQQPPVVPQNILREAQPVPTEPQVLSEPEPVIEPQQVVNEPQKVSMEGQVINDFLRSPEFTQPQQPPTEPEQESVIHQHISAEPQQAVTEPPAGTELDSSSQATGSE